ncbi:glycosyltransferase [Segetibacter sp. 3557_3]|uniref:glycosyltransferase family 2 protein n=1 Tax=Segetibacter sp. 3557_3 TaxID=2547429 RepID=UPI0010591CC4|nr:glycosyltransferase family 2 protein [Segetibacter sp. 3557_3]TDH23318.1 glycosyltransferase [Segetibacter sp. 3557_3]
MKISIITATYNSQATIGDTIRSVNSQTYKNIEHIIIDGASTDNTLNIVKELHQGPVVSERDKGIYDAMNKGIAIATGDVIGIINSDDFLANDEVIENVVKTFQSEICDVVYGDLVYVDPVDTDKVLRRWIAGKYVPSQFLQGWMPPHPTVFVKKKLYSKYGHFNLELKSSADYELLLRLLFVNKAKVKYLPGVLVRMRSGGQSNRSFQNRLTAHKEDYLAWKINGLSPKWYTLMMKPVRKIKQFIVIDR